MKNYILKLRDLDESQDAMVLLRSYEKIIVIGISLENDGDIEVGLNKQQCKELIEKLSDMVNDL